MEYKLCIESDNGKIDITHPDTIKKVSIKISQKEELANDRSDKLRGDLVIQGVINADFKNATKEIFEWSMKTKGDANIYKTVSIQVLLNDKLVRDYYLKNMYCVSYEEIFGKDIVEPSGEKEEDSGLFILVMKQKYGSIETIKVACE